jgi:hypothetical protein
MPPENTAVLDPETETEDEEVDGDDETPGDDNDADEDTDEEAADDEPDADGDASGDDGDGGSGQDDSPAVDAVPAPTGRQILDLLAGSPEAQQEMANVLQEIMAANANSAAAQAEAKEFSDLVEKGDYGEIGRRIVQRSQDQAVRDRVAGEVLLEEFKPVYAEIFAEPELQNLSAEDKASLDPKNFSDAQYVRALTKFVQTKRTEAAIEAEVEKRIKIRDEAAGNRDTAGKVKNKSVGASPGGTQGTGPARTSRELIASGLRSVINPPADGDDDDDD